MSTLFRFLFSIFILLFLTTSSYAWPLGVFGLGKKKDNDWVDITSSLSWSPTSKDFGSQNTGANTDQVFTLLGTEAEEISLSVTGTGYSLLFTTCGSNPFNLLTGTCTVTVRLTPASTGTLNGELVADATNQPRWAVASLTGVGVAACSDSSLSGFLVGQNFEGTGYDNSETWTEAVGTNGIVDENDTTATILRGSQQLKIYAGDSGQISHARKTFAANDTVYAHFLFTTGNVTTNNDIFTIEDVSQNSLLTVSVLSNGVLRALSTNSVSTAGALSSNTKYHIWVRYTKGTGANGIYSVAFSTTATEPTSGNNFASGSNSAKTAQAGIVRAWAKSQLTNYFDQILVRTTGGIVPCD